MQSSVPAHAHAMPAHAPAGLASTIAPGFLSQSPAGVTMAMRATQAQRAIPRVLVDEVKSAIDPELLRLDRTIAEVSRLRAEVSAPCFASVMCPGIKMIGMDEATKLAHQATAVASLETDIRTHLPHDPCNGPA